VSVGKPGQEPGGGGDLLTGAAGVGARTRALFGGAAEPAQDPPGGEGGDEPAVAVVIDTGQELGEEAFGAHQRLVAGGQHLVGHQGAQVVRGAPVRVGVEGLMAEGERAGGQLGQHLRAGALAQPVQRAARAGGGHDRVERRR
jgi:hypothetical protein